MSQAGLSEKETDLYNTEVKLADLNALAELKETRRNFSTLQLFCSQTAGVILKQVN